MYEISASIVVYNPRLDFLVSVINSFSNCKLEKKLIIVDHSPIKSIQYLELFPDIIYIHNPTNPGFGAGHNCAIKIIENRSKYHLILNPDIFFNEGTLEEIYNYMNYNIDVGLLMPKILFPDGSYQYLCKRNPNIFDLFIRGFLPAYLKKLLKKRINKYEFKDKNLNTLIFNVPYLSGCFMFFRTDILTRIGMFDERYFMYLEDADITRRTLSVSKTLYFPKTIVYHHYAGLTHKKWKYKWITIKSAITYFNKWGWLRNIY